MKIDELEARYTSAPGLYASLRSEAHRRATTYQWANGPLYGIDPLGLRLDAFESTVRPYQREPKSKKHNWRYGLLDDGRVSFEEQYTEFADRFYEEFWHQTADGPATVLYDYDPEKACINVQQAYLKDNKVSAFIRYAQNGVLVRAYAYHGDLVTRIEEHNKMHDPGMPPSYSYRRTLDLAYKDGDVWDVMATYADGSRSQLFREGQRL